MKVRLHTDAGLLGSGVTKAGVGFVIRSDEPALRGQVVREGAMVLEDPATISEAEYSAILWGLYNARMLGATKVDLYTDSQLCARQITGRYACRAKNLIPLLCEVKKEMGQFDHVQVNWIKRKRNVYADQLVRNLLKEER